MGTTDGAEAGTSTLDGKGVVTVMACSVCDVTWRGRPGDSCWACEHSAHTVKAPPLQVKIPAPA